MNYVELLSASLNQGIFRMLSKTNDLGFSILNPLETELKNR